MKSLAILTLCAVALVAQAQQAVKIVTNQNIWNAFSKSEQATLIENFPAIEITPSESIGVIQSVQGVNRSTPGTNSGAILGATVGQAMYIDRSFSGSNNYSATAQVGAAILGAALGSSLDAGPTARFVFNYAIKTLDGQLREVRVDSVDEFTRPVGQCVSIPAVKPVETSLCSTDKVIFLQKLSAIGKAPADALISQEPSGVYVNCRVPGVGLMTLEKNTCIQMDGVIEK